MRSIGSPVIDATRSPCTADPDGRANREGPFFISFVCFLFFVCSSILLFAHLSFTRSCTYIASLLIFCGVCKSGADALDLVDRRRAAPGERAVEWASHRRFVHRFAAWRLACFNFALPPTPRGRNIARVAIAAISAAMRAGGGDRYPLQLRATMLSSVTGDVDRSGGGHSRSRRGASGAR